jgi:hypothetical protein
MLMSLDDTKLYINPLQFQDIDKLGQWVLDR